MNQKLREAENFEKEASNLEENAKLQVDEAEKQKLLAEEKLQECITREERVFEDLQKLKVGRYLTCCFYIAYLCHYFISKYKLVIIIIFRN